MTALSYMRQTGIFDPAKNPHASATFVGVGGIGSFAAYATAKLGIPNITLIDMDTVEQHNVPCQMFDHEAIGYTKVSAMHDQITMLDGDHSIASLSVPLGDVAKLDYRGLVVSGLDSMSARSELWHDKLKLNPFVPLYIDGRLDGQTIVIYAVNPCNMDDVEEYEATLLSDDEVLAGVCTERSIIDVGFMVGSLISRMVRLHYTDQEVPKITVVDQKNLTIAHGGWLR